MNLDQLVEYISDAVVDEIKDQSSSLNTPNTLSNLSQGKFLSETLGLTRVFKQGPIVEGIKIGTANSGNHGHAGRPGHIGGSGGGGLGEASSSVSGVTKGKVFSDEEAYNWHEQGTVREWALGLPKDGSNALNDYSGFSYGDINNTLRGNPPTREFKRDATDEEKARLAANDYRAIDLGDGKTLQQSWHNEVVWRDVDTERVKQVTEMANSINDIIANKGIILSEAIEVSRGAYIPGLSVEDLKKKIGSSLTEKGFTSTFLGPAGGRATGDGYISYGVAESKYKRFGRDINHKEVGTAIKFEIVLPKGTHVASVEATRRVTYKHSDGTYDLDNKAHRSESELLLGSGANFKVQSVSEEKTIKVSPDSKTPVPFVTVRMQYVGGGSSSGGNK